MLKKGYGLRNTLIIGTGDKANEVKDIIYSYPKLGYKFSGFISVKDKTESSEEIGVLSDLSSLIKNRCIDEVIIASDQKYEELIISTLNICSDLNVNVKIVPGVYEIVSGMVKSEQVHGIPLVEVRTELMPFTSTIIKRLYDFVISLIVLILLLPLLILVSLINLALYKKIFDVQEKVGKKSKLFYSIRFYSNDKGFGKLLSMLWIIELPQLLNVVLNRMSLVGPEPESPEIIQKLSAEIPYFSRRMKVKPGITGWAQIKQKSYYTSDDYKKKLQFDFYYLENMSLLLDLKIVLNTLIFIFIFNGK